MRASRTLPAALVMAALTLTACHKKPKTAPTPVSTAVDTSALHQQHLDSIAAAERARQAAEDAAARARAGSMAQSEAATQAAMRASLNQTIYFDYNDSNLRSDAQAILDAKIPIMLANPDVTIRVAGNTDDRGSTEYNLALGQRRAATAKRYLTDHGIADSRIETVSYGEERPIAQGENEAAWQQNRRDEFTVTGGATGPLKHAGM